MAAALFLPHDLSNMPNGSKQQAAPQGEVGSAATAGFDFELTSIKGETREVVIMVEEQPSRAVTQITAPPKVGKRSNSRPSSPLRRSETPEQSFPPPPPIGGPPKLSVRTSPNLNRKASMSSVTGTHSPVMRSMFPRFDPTVPLAHQKYVPSMDRAPVARPIPSAPWQDEIASGPQYSPSLYSQQQNQSVASLVPPVRDNRRVSRAMPGSSLQFPMHLSEEPPPDLSAPEELLDLWSIANGQGSAEASETYTLGLHCDDLTINREKFSLTSSTAPFYNLTATPSSFTIARNHPINPSQTITTTASTLHTPTAPHPLISALLPKLAELMSLDQASSIALAHSLSRSDAADLQAEALARTRTLEEAHLLWDSDSSRYYLIHPSLSHGDPATFPIDIDNPSATLRIRSSIASSPPLLTLSLATSTLTIHTVPLAALSGASLYLLDTLLGALLALLLHLHRANANTNTNTSSPLPSPTLTTTFDPPPRHPTPNHRARALSSQTTLHPASASFPARSDDLEKGVVLPLRAASGCDLSQFQAYDLSDPRLGAGVKAVLRVLYWAFGLLVWCLGVGVGVLAAGVVLVGGGRRAVGGE